MLLNVSQSTGEYYYSSVVTLLPGCCPVSQFSVAYINRKITGEYWWVKTLTLLNI
uniref:Uncharacterized protein n=1 Tax=Arion vulgaris TaxID=1028688 RepID=A0A0B7AV61_9EUPU